MTSDLPPESDVGMEEQVKMLVKQMSEMQAKMKKDDEEKKKMQKTINGQQKKIEILQDIVSDTEQFERMYKYMGGESEYYVDINRILPPLEKQCNGDENKLEELRKWAEECKRKRVKRVLVKVGKGALVSGTIAGISLGTHAVLACGACALTAGATAGVIIGSLGAGAVVVLAGIGIYIIYRWVTRKSPETSEKNIVEVDMNRIKSTVKFGVPG